MITIPVHDLLLLPGVMFYFKKDMFPDRRITAEDVGEDILFMMLKEEKKASELQPDDFYPIGVSGKIEGIDDEGNVRVQAKERDAQEKTRTHMIRFTSCENVLVHLVFLQKKGLFRQRRDITSSNYTANCDIVLVIDICYDTFGK